MSITTGNPLDLYRDGLGLQTHTAHDSSFIVRAGVVPCPQKLLDAFVIQITAKAPSQAVPCITSQQLYEPITNPYEIRVLEIKPGLATEKLKAALHHCTVEFDHGTLGYKPRWAMSSTDYTKPVFFTALSYTWGESVLDVSIECDGFDKKITKSLEAALCQFRQPHESIMMWVDQICINQDDKTEKKQQIPIMSRIYTLATNTVIWLGEASDGSDSALALLEQIVSCLQFTFSNPDFDDLERLGLPAADSKHWKYLYDLLTRKWFTRVWIIQEAVLSSGPNTWSACGDNFTPWKTLTDACLYLDTCGISTKLGEMFSTSTTTRAPLGETISNIENIKNTGFPRLFTFLTQTRNAECKYPKDKIYGLLGLLNEKDRQAFRVSYESDYTDASLYRDVTVDFIRSDEQNPWMNLSLVLAQVDHEATDLPSWAPDWRVPPSTTALSAPRSFSGAYNACGRFSHANNRGKPMARILGGELTTPGVCFDTIAKIGDVFVKPDISYENPMIENPALLAAVTFASQMQNGPYGNVVFEALWQTLVAGKNDEGISLVADKDEKGISKCYNSFAKMFSFLIDESTGKLNALPGQASTVRQRKPKGENKMKLSSQSRRTLQMVRTAFRRASENRRLGITSKGYLGLYPSRVNLGDVVYVFDRCPLPYVLRSVGSEGKFKFIGECFVYGIMNGEAVSLDSICLDDVTLV